MKTILVTGATGNQGGAVVDALLEQPGRWRVRALTRTPDGKPARRLAARGVEVVGGDMADEASLREAMAGVRGIFSVQNTRTAGLEGEVRQGVNVANAAQAAGIPHVVYSSVGGAERARGIPHFDTKWRIERHQRDIGLPVTVLRPTAFMDGYTMRGARSIGLGMLAGVLGRDKTLQMIAVRDIGVFARLALADPGSYLGQDFEIAGDELTVPQIAAAFREVLGRRPRYPVIPAWMTRRMGPEAQMMIWFGESGYAADIPSLRALHPDLLTFRQWLARYLGPSRAATRPADGPATPAPARAPRSS
ncbi:MAG TPA: NmrA/HSCARG family protein [Streptosporangiaceae bacterium]